MVITTAVQSLCLNTAVVTISGLQSTLRHLYDKDLLLYVSHLGKENTLPTHIV